MLVWITVAAFLACSIWLTVNRKTREEIVTFSSWAIFITFFIIIIIVYLCSYGDYIETKKFIESNETALRLSIIQGQINAAVIGDLSNSNIGENLIWRFNDFLYTVTKINSKIITAKVVNESIFLDGFYYDWPEYPDLLPTDKIAASIEHFKKQINNIEGVVIFKTP